MKCIIAISAKLTANFDESFYYKKSIARLKGTCVLKITENIC